MSQPALTAYDTVIYPGYAYVQTHPDHIAALARLCGLSPAPIETCRVLEVGCGDAANLIPMAVDLPQATFRGFDLAVTSIQRGQAIISELGLANLTLEQLDVCQAPDRLGEFDYIIAHGFYSWVPQSARDKLMAICRASLAPQGVAFISYNTLPGGHIRRMIREMMLFHVDQAPDPRKKIAQAQALLGFLSKLSQGDDEYQRLLRSEFERVQRHAPAHLYHDDIAAINDHFYLYEFVNHAIEHGLQFLSDVNSSFVHVAGLDAETAAALSDLETNPILREQYLDFACCRRFRQTLLCHESLPISYQLDPGRIEGLFISSPAAPVSDDVNLAPDLDEEFRGAHNATLKTNHPVVKAMMVALRAVWPERSSFLELRHAVAALLEDSPDSIPSSLLLEGISAAFSRRMLGLHAYRPRITSQAGDFPMTNPFVRWQAKQGVLVTNLLHQTVKVEADQLTLLSLLDGNRSREELLNEVKMSPEALAEVLSQLAAVALLQA